MPNVKDTLDHDRTLMLYAMRQIGILRTLDVISDADVTALTRELGQLHTQRMIWQLTPDRERGTGALPSVTLPCFGFPAALNVNAYGFVTAFCQCLAHDCGKLEAFEEQRSKINPRDPMAAAA